MIPRIQMKFAKDRLFKGKAMIIYGPRQVGKSTFTDMLLSGVDKSVLRLNGDDADTRELLLSPNATILKSIIGNSEIVYFDEAQRISEIGLVLKIIVDQIKEVQVIATGSSSFELAGKINEPLTGRKYEMNLLPISYLENRNHTDFLTEKRLLEHRLVFGSYPEIVSDGTNAKEHLKLLANSYLYKDLFELDQIKNSALLQKIVKALAFQIGSEVRVSELSKQVAADHKTIDKYITLLEQAYIVFPLTSYSKNVRNELRKSRKIYFYDNGILNAVTGNYNAIRQRSDVEALWENYLVSERKKWLNINKLDKANHFWRTTQQQEVDYIEATHDSLLGFEFKWNPNSRARFPKTFTNAYPEAVCEVISTENYHEFLSV